MKISEVIAEFLRNQYNGGNGLTYIELEKKYRISKSAAQRILSGQRDASGIRIETLERMFPNATISLNGNTVTNNGTAGDILSHNNFFSASGLDEVISQVMASDIPADAKVKVYQIIEGVKKRGESCC